MTLQAACPGGWLPTSGTVPDKSDVPSKQRVAVRARGPAYLTYSQISCFRWVVPLSRLFTFQGPYFM
jgi:hypothetical protein